MHAETEGNEPSPSVQLDSGGGGAREPARKGREGKEGGRGATH